VGHRKQKAEHYWSKHCWNSVVSAILIFIVGVSGVPLQVLCKEIQHGSRE
jgi:uncharacterized iron-regulated membrane protein